MKAVNLEKIADKYINSTLEFDRRYFTQLSVSSSEYVSPRLVCDYFYDYSRDNIKVCSTKIIDTIKGTSIEGQHLTGKKLTLIGKIDLDIIFRDKECKNNIYMLDKTIDFSTFIIVPDDICENYPITILYDIEDIEVVPISINKIFISVMILLKYDT